MGTALRDAPDDAGTPAPKQVPRQYDSSATDELVRGSGLVRPDVTEETIHTYIDYFVRTGFLPAPRPRAESARAL